MQEFRSVNSRNKTTRLFAAIVCLISNQFMNSSAHAQTAQMPSVLTPLNIEPDGNGVNLTTGKITIELPALSVPGAGNLQYQNPRDYLPYVKGEYFQSAEATGPAGNANFSVHYGGSASESFKCEEGECVSVSGRGSRFVPSTRFLTLAGEGIRYHFNRKSIDVIYNSNPFVGGVARAITYYADAISYPSGEKHTIEYATTNVQQGSSTFTYYRPVKVTSNLGYFLTLTYAGNDIATTAWGRVTFAAIYKSDNPTVALVSHDYSVIGEIKDIAGNIYKCGGCSQTLTDKSEKAAGYLTLPGDTVKIKDATALSGGPAGINVVGQVVNAGSTWTYSYENLGAYPVTSFNANFSRVTITDALGNTRQALTELNDDVGLRIKSTIDPLGRTTTYEYQGVNLTKITYPEGNSVEIQYDDYGNVIEKRSRAKPGAAIPDLVEKAYFAEPNCVSVSCYRIKWMQDGKGNQTDYTWDPAHWGLLTSLLPPDAVGKRQKTINTYESIDTGQGKLLYRLNKMRVCGVNVGSTAECDTPVLSETQYSYWQNSFLPRELLATDLTTGQTLRTCYSYDQHGRKITETPPMGTGSSCP